MTIVVLLILAGITITYVMGDNSIFKKASEAKLQTDIAKYKEMLETAKTPIIIEGLGTFNPDRYFEYIENQGIIEDKEKDVVDNEDGTYDVTTKPGYIFEVELMPNKEKPTDAEITYLGQAGKIAPIIKKIEVSATSTSITGKVTVTRLGKGTVTYYYKKKSAGDNEYKEITSVTEETGATQSTGITAGEEYIIKVVAKNDAGETVDTAEITATKIPVESITLNKTEEIVGAGKEVTLTANILPEDATNKNVRWESSDTAVATVNENGVITGKTAGTVIITASTTDGSNKATSCTVTVKSVSLNKTTTTIEEEKTETLTATVLPADTVNKNVTWSSSNTAVATVNSSGVVTGVTAGNATITVSTTDESKATATCDITVIKPPTVADIVNQIQETTKTIKDENGNQVVIPGGFKVVPNGTSNVTYNYDTNHKPCVQDGIVIEDGEENQFVWIPIGDIKNKDNTTTTITLGRYTFDKTNGTPTLKQNADNYSESISIGGFVELNYSSKISTARDLGDFVTKTKTAGGYYLGRYGASQSSDGKVESKYNKTLWTNITQPKAAEVAREMYNCSYVDSDLVNGYSWDTAIVFVQLYSGNGNYANQLRLVPVKQPAGFSGDVVCNIYDMASNCLEWSTEFYSGNAPISYCAARGGSYFDKGTYTPSTRVNYGTSSSSYNDFSFRVLLYVL